MEVEVVPGVPGRTDYLSPDQRPVEDSRGLLTRAEARPIRRVGRSLQAPEVNVGQAGQFGRPESSLPKAAPFQRVRGKEGGIPFAARLAQQQQRQFAGVVIAPHRTLAVRHLLAGRDIIPAVGTMIDRVQQQALVFGIRGEIRLVEQGIRHGQARLAIAVAVLLIASGRKIIPQANQALRRDGGGGTVHRLPAVERVGGLREISAQAVQIAARPCPTSGCRPRRSWRGKSPPSRGRPPGTALGRRHIASGAAPACERGSPRRGRVPCPAALPFSVPRNSSCSA